MDGKIFISYRRTEDAGFAGRLFDRLEAVFPRERLFMDVDSIEPGLDFVTILASQVAECDVLLALIGRGWLNVVDASGQRRLDSADDFVRIEIASGLAQGKRVIPVLIGDAAMPPTADLPEVLKPLTRRHAVRLTHERFNADTEGLIRVLASALAQAKTRRQAEEAAQQKAGEERLQAEAETRRKAAEEQQRNEEDARRLTFATATQPESASVGVNRQQPASVSPRPSAHSTIGLPQRRRYSRSRRSWDP